MSSSCQLRIVPYIAKPRVVYFHFCRVSVVICCCMMDTPEPKGDELGSEGLKKRAGACTNRRRTAKEARTVASSDTRCLEDIPVPRQRTVEESEAEVQHLVRALDVEKGAVLSLLWVKLDVIAYVNSRPGI